MDIIEKIHAWRDPECYMDDHVTDPTIPGTVIWFRQQNRGYTTSNVPPRYAGATTDRTEVHQWVLNLLADRKHAPSLLLQGTTGTGKTHAAYAALILLAESCMRSYSWMSTSTAALYGDLRPSTGRDTEKVFLGYANTPLLLLDDLGSAKTTEWTEEVTYRLIDHRYNHCLPSIFTTNARKGELSEKLGDRTASRLTQMCSRLLFEGDDRRRLGGG